MKIFSCSACKHLAFFENSQCVRCGHLLSYLPDRGLLSAMEPEGSDSAAMFLAVDSSAAGARYRLCQNYLNHGVCNWAIPEAEPHEECLACRLNETAKRRLLFTLMELGLPLETKRDQPETGLAFAFKKDGANGERVLTGHCDGLVTINVSEADSPSRERARVELGERYRTLLGHFRHESGHYYWDRLLKGSPALSEFHELFGDEQQDYAEAVQRHYAAPHQNWADDFVSSYATMHPWEDWAETWAHYLHMVDTLETAQSHGLALRPLPVGGASVEPVTLRGIHRERFDDLIRAWVPLTVALNSLNRSMGLADAYPFVLAERVVAKLELVHQVVQGAVSQRAPLEPPATRRAPEPAQLVNPA